MKTIISTLLLCTLVLGELPPPYPRQGFRPNPQLGGQLSSSSRYPQTAYGPPTQHLTAQIPSKLTIEQLIRITEQLQSSRGRVVNHRPGVPLNSYYPPPREPQQSYGPPSKLQINQLRPQSPSFLQPHVSYGAPQPSEFQNQYRPPQNSQGFSNQNNLQRPQTQYVSPQNSNGQSFPQPQNTPPSTSYGVPDIRNVETFGEQQQKDEAILRQNLLNNLKEQHLPYKSPTGFRPQGQQNVQPQIQPSISQQYLPSLGQNNPQHTFGEGQPGNIPQTGGINPSNIVPQNSLRPAVNNPSSNRPDGGEINYLPPQSQTTPRGVFVSRATTLRPSTVRTTPKSVDISTVNYDYDYDLQQTTEASLNKDGSEAGPNVSISNAVAGADNFFYLQQPDGRLQRVVLQKTQEPNSKPEEYVANYYFQNIQTLPNAVYTPLISLGSYAQK